MPGSDPPHPRFCLIGVGELTGLEVSQRYAAHVENCMARASCPREVSHLSLERQYSEEICPLDKL